MNDHVSTRLDTHLGALPSCIVNVCEGEVDGERKRCKEVNATKS